MKDAGIQKKRWMRDLAVYGLSEGLLYVLGEKGAHQAIDQIAAENEGRRIPACGFDDEKHDDHTSQKDTPERAFGAPVDFLEAGVAYVAEHQRG